MPAPVGTAVPWYDASIFTVTHECVEAATQHRDAALSYLLQLESLSPRAPGQPRLQQRAEDKLWLLFNTWDLIHLSLDGNIP